MTITTNGNSSLQNFGFSYQDARVCTHALETLRRQLAIRNLTLVFAVKKIVVFFPALWYNIP